MKLLIEIPKEFEKDYVKDRFNECFERIMCDLKYYIEKDGYGVAGRYEMETLEMLNETFKTTAQIVEDDFVTEKENQHEYRI